jgi:uncharacterized protein
MFEFDAEKSVANLAEHSIDFEEAQALWFDTGRYEIPSGEGAEERWLLIGKIGERHWTAIYTMRGDSILIISVRRSRTSEVRDYDSL